VLTRGVCCLLLCVQVTGKNPIAALQEHLADPWATTIFSKAVVVPGQAVQPACMIPQYTEFSGVKSECGFEAQICKKNNNFYSFLLTVGHANDIGMMYLIFARWVADSCCCCCPDSCCCACSLHPLPVPGPVALNRPPLMGSCLH